MSFGLRNLCDLRVMEKKDGSQPQKLGCDANTGLLGASGVSE